MKRNHFFFFALKVKKEKNGMLHHTLGDLKLGAEEQVCLPNRD
jgi:hypothetical protein